MNADNMVGRTVAGLPPRRVHRRGRHRHRLPRRAPRARSGRGEDSAPAAGAGPDRRQALPARGRVRRAGQSSQHRPDLRLRRHGRIALSGARVGPGRAAGGVRQPLGQARSAAGGDDRRAARRGPGRAHKAGIIHRDLKPANIMYDPATQTAKLLDFGIARDAELNPEERLTRAGFFVGTLQYVAPETLSGELVNEQADVYSLATIAYYLLTQELPFTGKSPRELFQQLLTQPPVPLNQAVKGLRFPGADRGGGHARAGAGSVQAFQDGGRIRRGVVHGGPAGRGQARASWPRCSARAGSERRGPAPPAPARALGSSWRLRARVRPALFLLHRLPAQHDERRRAGADRAHGAGRHHGGRAGARARSAA